MPEGKMKLQKETLKEKPQLKKENKILVQHEQVQLNGNSLKIGEVEISSASLSMPELIGVTRQLLEDKEIQSYLRLSRLKNLGCIDYAG